MELLLIVQQSSEHKRVADSQWIQQAKQPDWVDQLKQKLVALQKALARGYVSFWSLQWLWQPLWPRRFSKTDSAQICFSAGQSCKDASHFAGCCGWPRICRKVSNVGNGEDWQLLLERCWPAVVVKSAGDISQENLHTSLQAWWPHQISYVQSALIPFCCWIRSLQVCCWFMGSSFAAPS